MNWIGDFNTEYARALVALAGLGANTVEVALYPKIEQDADGNTSQERSHIPFISKAIRRFLKGLLVCDCIWGR